MGTFERLDTINIMCPHLPLYVLLERPQRSWIAFLILPENVFPVFLAKSTSTMRGISVTRLQIPMTPEFAITDYKVQGATFRTVMLNLHKHFKSTDKGLHKRFCFTYVQLSRLQTLDAVGIL